MRKINSISGFLFVLFILFTACDDQPQFKISEYRISADETEDILNIEEPQYILSENTLIIKAVFDNGDIVITSVREGRTNVTIGDKIGFSNQARIQILVKKTGRIIIEEITKFDGRLLIPNIKNAVTINGSVGNEITQTRIDLQMNGTHFIVTEDIDVTSWFINIPAGLTAVIFDIFATNPGYPNEVSIYISGTPLSASSEVIRITVPAENAGRNQDVYFNTRADAVFNVVGE